jgi:hypothetical protein
MEALRTTHMVALEKSFNMRYGWLEVITFAWTSNKETIFFKKKTLKTLKKNIKTRVLQT